jgi:hypothetical protein
MSKTLQVGTEVFEYPDNLQNPGWGEEASDWARAVTDLLGTLSGPNDIAITSFTLQNNIAVDTSIIGLRFATSQVVQCDITYIIKRTYDSGATVVSESGRIIGNYNGSVFSISRESAGDDCGVSISVDGTGQFKYQSSNLANHVSSTIKFAATTITNA